MRDRQWLLDRRTFVTALEHACRVADSEAPNRVSSYVLLSVDDEGRMTVAADNAFVMLRYTYHAGASPAGARLLPAHRLLRYLKLLPGDTIAVRLSTGHGVALSSGSSRAVISGLDPGCWSDQPQIVHAHVQSGAHGIPVSSMVRMVRRVQAVAATARVNEDRILVDVDVASGRARMAATDRHRLVVADEPGGELQCNLLISYGQLLTLRYVLDAAAEGGSVYVASDDNSVLFTIFYGEPNIRVDIVGRRVSERFPSYNRILEQSKAGAIRVPVRDLVHALRRVAAAVCDVQYAHWQVLGDALIVSARSDVAETEERVDVEHLYGPTMSVLLNSRYALEALETCWSDRVLVRYGDARDPVLVEVDEQAGGYRHAISPVYMQG